MQSAPLHMHSLASALSSIIKQFEMCNDALVQVFEICKLMKLSQVGPECASGVYEHNALRSGPLELNRSEVQLIIAKRKIVKEEKNEGGKWRRGGGSGGGGGKWRRGGEVEEGGKRKENKRGEGAGKRRRMRCFLLHF